MISIPGGTNYKGDWASGIGAIRRISSLDFINTAETYLNEFTGELNTDANTIKAQYNSIALKNVMQFAGWNIADNKQRVQTQRELKKTDATGYHKKIGPVQEDGTF